jgi:hypothetical protein
VAWFIVERYLPDIGAAQLQESIEQLSAATAALAIGGAEVRYLGSSYVPEEESCFCRFESDSIESVRLACHRASFSYARILEAKELSA